jgi:exopolysaccharide production protein ExoZ
MNKMVVSIQYLRGLAAMMVVYHHSVRKVLEMNPDSIIPYSGFGNAGVDIFFVISGFIMWVTTVSTMQTPAYFWYRRIIRIVPLYWFFILVIIIPKLLVPEIFQTTQLEPSHIVKSLLFIPHYHPLISHQIWPILIPGWTLNYEMFFYLLFGASLFISPRWRFPVLASAFLFLVLLGQWITSDNPLFITYTDKLILEFFAGIVIGVLYMRGFTLSPVMSISLMGAAIILLIGFETFLPPGGMRIITWGIPAILMVFATLSLDTAGKIPRIRSLRLIGDASYSIYLSHILSIEVIESLWEISDWHTDTLMAQLIFVAVCIGTSTMVGIAAFYMVEQPMLKGLRPLWRQKTQ